MRTPLLALTLLTVVSLAGCTGTGRSGPKPGASKIRQTPVVRETPSFSQRQAERRRQQGEEVVGQTEVQGRLAR